VWGSHINRTHTLVVFKLQYLILNT